MCFTIDKRGSSVSFCVCTRGSVSECFSTFLVFPLYNKWCGKHNRQIIIKMMQILDTYFLRPLLFLFCYHTPGPHPKAVCGCVCCCLLRDHRWRTNIKAQELTSPRYCNILEASLGPDTPIENIGSTPGLSLIRWIGKAWIVIKKTSVKQRPIPREWQIYRNDRFKFEDQ